MMEVEMELFFGIRYDDLRLRRTFVFPYGMLPAIGSTVTVKKHHGVGVDGHQWTFDDTHGAWWPKLYGHTGGRDGIGPDYYRGLGFTDVPADPEEDDDVA